MNKEEELLFKHFEGQLSENEKNQLEELIKNDPSIEKSLKANSILRNIIDETKRSDLIDKMKEWDREKHSPLRVVSKKIIPLGIAAGLLIFFGLFFTINYNNYSNSSLFVSNYDPHFNIQRGSSNDLPLFRKTEITILKKSNAELQELVNDLRNIPVNSPGYAQSKYLLGHAYLSLGNTNEAIREWEELAEFDNIFSQDADWFMSLAHLKNNDGKSAMTLLNSISDNQQHQYYTNATELQKQLNNFWRLGR